MNIFKKLFPRSQLEKQSALEEAKGILGKDGRVPSFPRTEGLTPLRLLKAGNFYVSLLKDVPPFSHERFGHEPIPLCAFATSPDGSTICAYTLQSVRDGEAPRLVVWQPNGQYRIYAELYTEPISPDEFFKSIFFQICREVGLDGKCEVTEMVKKR